LAPPSTQINTLAIVSLVAACASFVAHIVPGVGGFTVALVAVITGHMARNQIKRTGERGWGLATAGLVIGYFHLALIVLVVLAVIALILWFGLTLFGVSRH
jgi:TRAP-type C4-dicarboxylate transport system permease large subunit